VSESVSSDIHKILFMFEEHAVPPDGGGTWSASCALGGCGQGTSWTPGSDGVALAELVQAAATHEASLMLAISERGA
jgi:hypothetical protein